MKQTLKELTLDTTKKKELIDITSQVEKFIEGSRIKGGLCLIYSLHVTAGIIVNENEKIY
jgi:secondary thiamine-phosphate synthase enzyme